MLNIPTKVDGADTFSAAEFNSLNNELKNTIESSGQTMAGGDLFQIAKASAMYGGAGNFYDEVGTVDNYVLSPTTTLKGVDSYKDGLEVRWITSTENTGPTTINVNSLGVKDLVSSTGFPLTAGSLPLGKYVIARYDLANDRFVVEKFIELTSANTGRNLIINGDFSVWQRGTSNTTTTSEVYVADRWYGVNSIASTITLSRQTFSLGQTDVPNNPTYYHQLSWLGTGGAASPQIGHRIENVARLGAKEVTLTFNAKTGTDFDVEVYVVQHFGTGGSPSSDVSTLIDTKSIIATWGEFTNTSTIPSVSGKTLGTNGDDYTEIRFIRNGGTAAGTFDIANVQLEFGDTATEFEYVSPADQLARCQRYYQTSNGQERDHVAHHYDSTNRYGWITFPSTMRAAPAGTISNVFHFENGATITGTITATNITGTMVNGAGFQITNSVTTNQGGAALIYLEWTADAEL